MPAIEHAVEGEARRLGFAAVGFAAAGESFGADAFDDWLRSGAAAGMDYLHRHAPLRRHPDRLAPGTRTVIALAARYPVNPHPASGFCMLARTRDYHDVLRAKLRRLVHFLRERVPPIHARICVDSAPLPEREWAVRAGLGWQGPQGQVIVPGAGACTVFGFLLVDLPMVPSVPTPSRCGDCRRCVQSCPTGAIPEPGRVDARRCRSYLTIEHAGPFDRTSAARVGGALFGCDCCTSVCPWNEHAALPVMPELEPGSLPMPGPDELAAMTPSGFNARFRGTTVHRSGLERLRRNARAVLSCAPGSAMLQVRCRP